MVGEGRDVTHDFRELLPIGIFRSTLAKLCRYVSAASFPVGDVRQEHSRNVDGGDWP